MDKKLYVECECDSMEHTLRLSLDTNDGDLYTEVHLMKKPFYKRIWYAIKYIFGYQCKYGAFDCTMIKKTQIDAIIKLLEEAKGLK